MTAVELPRAAARLPAAVGRLARPWPVVGAHVAGLDHAGELSRGLARGGVADAHRHAAAIVSLERRLHVFGEAAVQRAAGHVAALPELLGYAYLTLHLTVTAAVLVWLYRSRRGAYLRLRNTLAVASALAVAGYALFPTAPPRLAGVGIADTVSSATSVNLGSSLVSALYNPYAAVPSMHVGFAVLVGATVFRLARRPLWRIAGAVYPLLVLFVVVATGNHFFADAAIGVALTGLAAVVTSARRGRVATAQ
jgi:hypothetical protein